MVRIEGQRLQCSILQSSRSPLNGVARASPRVPLKRDVAVTIRSHCPLSSGGLQQAKLGERCHAIIQTNFLADLAALKTQNCNAGEVHLATASSRQ